MHKTLKYTEDKKFVRWVLHPNKELNSFWEDYTQNNPSEIKNIEAARIIILQLKSKKEDISATETDLLFSTIQKGIEEAKNEKSTRRFGINILKYAAIAIILISVGIGYKYYQNSSDFLNTAQKLASNQILNFNNTQLLLCDGQIINIDEKKSFIEYLPNGIIVLNSNDTVHTNASSTNNLNQLLVPRGSNANIKLSDGTLVHINADSRLIYPCEFTEDIRETYLVGEGFFEVAHNEDIPFHTTTDRLTIEVLGTKYNVMAYPSEEVVETFLVEGKVSVKQNADFLAKNELILKPLEKASYSDKDEELVISNVGYKEYVSWYEGYLNFDSKEVGSIIEKIERNFDIEIKLNNPALGKKEISGKLKLEDEKAETVVKVLANTASFKMEKLDDSTYLLK